MYKKVQKLSSEKKDNMITRHQLRIGSYVMADEKIQQVSLIDNETAQVRFSSVASQTGAAVHKDYSLDSIQPVLLTDDVLRQCNFVFHDYFKFWQLISGQDEKRLEMDIDIV